MGYQLQQILVGFVSSLLIVAIAIYGYLIFTDEPEWSFETNPYIVLASEKTIRTILLTDSFREKPHIDGVWIPSKEDILSLESMLTKLNEGEFDSLSGISSLALPVNQYYRQYMGVVFKGEKVIYINAVSNNEMLKLGLKNLEHTREKNVLGRAHCGSYCWGGIYDPFRKLFSELKVDIL
jgi:hypothetical protein